MATMGPCTFNSGELLAVAEIRAWHALRRALIRGGGNSRCVAAP
jgi:hypothetical protein